MADRFRMLNKHYYKVLGLACSASPSAIRSAYKKLAMIWHPDKCKNEEAAAAAKLKFQEIQEAYAVLSDARRKLLYDNGLYDPNDNEADVEGLSSIFNEVSSKIAEINAAEKINGKEKSYEEFRELCDSLFGSNYKMAHFDCAPTSATTNSSDVNSHFSYAPTDFRYPAAQFDYPPITHRKTTSLKNKRDGQLQEGYVFSDIHRIECLYDFDMGHARIPSAKRRKHTGEEEDCSSDFS